MSRLRSMFTYYRRAINPDRSVITDPYYAFRTVGKKAGVVGGAMLWRNIKWRLEFSGTFVFERFRFDGALLRYEATFDAYADIVLISPIDERAFAKIIPPPSTSQVVLYNAVGTELNTDLTPTFGSYSLSIDGIPSESGGLIIPGSAIAANEVEINTSWGTDYDENTFGTKLKIVLPIAANTSGTPTYLFTVFTESTPGLPGGTPQPITPDMTVNALNNNNFADQVLVPIHSLPALDTDPDYVTIDLDFNAAIVPYGQSRFDHPDMIDCVMRYADGTEDSRILNQDSSSHRRYFAPYDLVP